MDVATIRVGRRTVVGSRRVSPLRAEGLIPAVLYGGAESPINLAVDEHELQRHLRQHHRVYSLTVDGSEVPAFLKDIQWDTLTDRLLHVDFLRIDMSKPIETDVELAYIGHPVGASHGGSLVKDLVVLPIRCLPDKMPEELEVKVAHLDVGDAVHVRDLELPEGVTTELEGDHTICHVAASSATKQALDEAAEEAGEGGEEQEGAPESGEGEGDQPKPEEG